MKRKFKLVLRIKIKQYTKIYVIMKKLSVLSVIEKSNLTGSRVTMVSE